MALLRRDPTFYPSRRLAMQAPAAKLVHVAALNCHPSLKPNLLSGNL